VSEVWIERQVRNFMSFTPKLVSWLPPGPRVVAASEGLNVAWLPERPDPHLGLRRWIHRLRTAPGRNFFAAAGAERRDLHALMAVDRPAVILAHFGTTALRVLPVALDLNIPIVAHFHGFVQPMLTVRFGKRHDVS